MKRMVMLLTAIFLMVSILIPVSAAVPPVVWDEANLLTDTEEQVLAAAVTDLKDTYGIDAMIVIKDSLDGNSAQNCADELYDLLGGSEDGVIFLLAMQEREWYISTCGEMIYALTDYGIQQLGEACVPYLSSGDYYEAFSLYLLLLPEYLDAYLSGTPVDGYADYSGDYYHGDRDEVVYYEEESTPSFGLSLVIGVAVAAIALVIMRSSMNTKRRQHSAVQYLKEGSFSLTKHRDLFLYSNITKTKKQEQSSSGGGSSVHRSSGGRSHGGGGGKF